MNNTTHYLQDYQPVNYCLKTVSLVVDLFEDHALITNTMHFVQQHPGVLQLNGEALELLAIEMNGVVLSTTQYHLSPKELTILEPEKSFVLMITTRIRPQDNTSLSGIFRTNGIFCTQCEAEGFRRITYFLDRPDVMTVYHTRIIADKTVYPVLLSNGNLLDSGDLPGGRHWALWHDPFKKPCYLFALVAGDLASVRDIFTTASGRVVDLRIYTEKGCESQCDHAMQSLKAAMRWDEIKFGREYDLDCYMIVAVRDFNMGAMENKGLNIFNAKYILATPSIATDEDYFAIESVVAHEYFHNWTGNRVTCRDWFQLSLKEGLTVFRDQEFSRDMNSRDVCRIQDVIALRNLQFPEDAGSMAHPVQPQSYQQINNFYTATVYNKGAEVIRMQQTLCGVDGFRRGMDLYFQRHDGQAVTIHEFVAAMEDANDIDLTQFKRWYYQAGTPHVTVTREFRDNTLSLTLTQVCAPTADQSPKEPLHMPIRISLYDHSGKKLTVDTPVLSLTESQQTFVFNALPSEPLVSLLQQFSAPIVLHHAMSEAEQLALLRFETDGFAKWSIAQTMFQSYLHRCYQQQDQTCQVSPLFLTTLQDLLSDGSDLALCALLLTPPSLEEAMTGLTEVDVLKLEQAREWLSKTIGQALTPVLQNMYAKLWDAEDHQMNHAGYARRALRNLCLWYLMKADDEAHLSLCQRQYQHARTMTDQLLSCRLLMNVSSAQARAEACANFYHTWSGYDLVMDKWFSMQAQSPCLGTIAHIEALMQHVKFDLKNPNKVRALLGAFSLYNPQHFHAQDGSGYVFLSKMLLQLDQLNPQVAARLAMPLTRGQRYDAERQRHILQCLTNLSEHVLSDDLQEIITKSRQAYAT